MKKLFIIILLCLVPLASSARITIVKQGTNTLKVTGLVRNESPLGKGTIYLNKITGVSVYGNLLVFMQGDKAVLTVRFTDISNKMGKTTSVSYVEYVIANYLTS